MNSKQNHLVDFLQDIINPEVFAIKNKEAFLGGKFPNGNFHFVQLPFTAPDAKAFDGAGFDALKLDDIFRNTRAYIIEKPSNAKCAELWHATYLASLKDGGSIICATADADSVVEHFTNKFTKKTEI